MKSSQIVRKVLRNTSGKGVVSRVDIDHVDVIPIGSRTAIKKVKLSGDAGAVTVGDEVSLVNVQGEMVAVSSLTYTDVPASEIAPSFEYALRDHTHEKIDADFLDGKHSDRYVQIDENGIANIMGDLMLAGSLGSSFDRFMGELGGTADLNACTTTGRWHQYQNALAASGTGYPTPKAGVLLVYSDRSGYIYQTYQTYDGADRYFRSYYSGTWYPWRRLVHEGNLSEFAVGNADTVDGYHATALPPHTVAAQDGTNEGGQVTLNGAGSNKQAYIDNYASRLRLVTTDSGGTGHAAIDIDNAALPNVNIYGNAIVSNQLRADSYIDHKEGALPGTPSSGFSRQFVNSEGQPFIKRDDGVQIPMMTASLNLPIPGGVTLSGAVVTTVQTNSRGLAFRDGQYDMIFWNFVVPKGWGYKTAQTNIFWCPSNTATGNCWWVTEVRRLTPGAVLDPNGYSGPYGWTAAPGVAFKVVKTTISMLAMGAEGEAMTYLIWRNGPGANDTYGGTAYLMAANIELV